MSVLRPPCGSQKVLIASVIILILSVQSVSAGAGELDLPDLVVPRRFRTDAVQPYEDLHVDGEWTFRLPSFRRLYRIPVRIDAVVVSPDPSPETVGIPLKALSSSVTGAGNSVFSSRAAANDEPIIKRRGENRLERIVLERGEHGDRSGVARAATIVREFLNG
jgi:hypothetical protein